MRIASVRRLPSELIGKRLRQSVQRLLPMRETGRSPGWWSGRSPGQPRGRILAVKWGMNPNSSSLGVDVTFLLFGAATLAMATPVISALIRLGWRAPAAPVETYAAPDSPAASTQDR